LNLQNQCNLDVEEDRMHANLDAIQPIQVA